MKDEDLNEVSGGTGITEDILKGILSKDKLSETINDIEMIGNPRILYESPRSTRLIVKEDETKDAIEAMHKISKKQA